MLFDIPLQRTFGHPLRGSNLIEPVKFKSNIQTDHILMESVLFTLVIDDASENGDISRRGSSRGTTAGGVLGGDRGISKAFGP